MQITMVTYQLVYMTIPVSNARIANSPATRRTMPTWKRLKAIFLHPTVQGGPGQPQRFCRTAYIVLVTLQRPDDGGFFDFVQRRDAGWARATSTFRQRKIAHVQQFTFAQYHRAFNGVTQGPHIARPGPATQFVYQCR